MRIDDIKKLDIKSIEDTKWFKVVRRDNSPFFNSIIRIGSSIKNKELPFESRMSNYLILDNDAYADEDEFKNLKDGMITLLEKDESILREYFDKVIKDSEDLIDWSKKTDRLDFNKKNNEELLKILDIFLNKSFKMMSHLWPPLGPEEWIIQKIEDNISKNFDIKDLSELEKIVNILVTPEDYSSVKLKKKTMLGLAIKIKKFGISNIKQEIEANYKQFAWVTDYGLFFKPQKYDKFIEELNILTKNNPEKKIKAMQDEISLIKSEKKDIIEKLKLDKKIVNLCNYAQIFPYIRFVRIESVIESATALNNFFKEIEKRLPVKNISLFYFWEIKYFLKGKELDFDNIKSRKDGHSFIIFKYKIYYLNKEEADRIKEKIESVLKKSDFIKGQIASMGFAKGSAKVLFSAKDSYKVKKGDILVTSMTTPDYVPAMQKASAFVTDEGGISCHAAIVSREMKKPCIIGTKIATKLLKDGDLVEVDANKGILKILKK